jgi:hypothetical protein
LSDHQSQNVGVTKLLTVTVIDDRRPAYSVRAVHYAVLTDGRKLILLDDRGWSASRVFGAVEDVVRHAQTVVGPDAPWGGRTEAEMETGHWMTLADTLADAGIEISADALSHLPHEVVLSDRLRDLVGG